MSASRPVRPYVARSGAVGIPPMAGRFVLLPPYLHGRPPVSYAGETLPSIDEYLDHSPPIEQFAPDAPPATVESDWPSWGNQPSPPASAASEGWGRDDWQGYDWSSASKLGSAPADEASAAWASTDWSEPGGSREARQSAAEALARALEQISRRIRSGELRVPSPETRKDDAAIAGTLAALLGIRR